jgi:hypothetical protein
LLASITPFYGQEVITTKITRKHMRGVTKSLTFWKVLAVAITLFFFMILYASTNRTMRLTIDIGTTKRTKAMAGKSNVGADGCLPGGVGSVMNNTHVNMVIST